MRIIVAEAIWAVLLLVSPWASRAWNTYTWQSTLSELSLTHSHTHHTYMLPASSHEQSSLRGGKHVGQAAEGNSHILGLITTTTSDQRGNTNSLKCYSKVCMWGKGTRGCTHTHTHTLTYTPHLHAAGK